MSKKDYEWFYGPPPSIGWWPTQDPIPLDVVELRWWNGRFWSSIAKRCDGAKRITDAAETPSAWSPQYIKWRARPSNWPARSRT